MNTNIMTIGSIANIIAYGNHNNRHCKAVLAVEARLAFTSMTDLAEHFGVNQGNVSFAVKTGGTIKGVHVVLLSDTNKAMEIIMAQAHKEREIQEEARRKEEKRLAKIEKEKQKRNALIARTKERIEKHEAKAKKEAEVITSLKEELAKLESEAK